VDTCTTSMFDMTNTAATIRPYLDTVTGVIRCYQIVRDGIVLADGIATHQDAEDRLADDFECEGHVSTRGDLMGAASYCDGRCRR
jgi:hypothetical protein